ncbi:hypothetical protein LOK74_09310 [Brevibacillus humidisoli]|uniref:YkvI family membrane protein n=1 Tax=Brevibacillus humidisoli TaxID=2895522 RepID=UPI001E44E175|nr:hypothetical protein [Brevibacillus humidisoli]UFJ42666.1 hypothetical protein LOK74_09310 [Brevibacillus humidisoli]
MQDWGKSIQVAATYIGTIVGAGFASGQEILAFFTSYGVWGTVGIALTTGLFMWLGYKMMRIAREIGSPSYESFNKAMFGPLFGRVINLIVFITLLGVTTVMLAGSGAIYEEQFRLPYLIGILATIGLGMIALNKGLDRLLVVNSIVVPSMLLFSCLILFSSPATSPVMPEELPTQYGFIWESILYVSFNLAMAQSVLIPMGYQIKNVQVLKNGAIIGGLGLGFMLIVAHIAMLSHWNDVRLMDIPMAFITEQWNDYLGLFFIIVLYAEIFTTLISNVYGITEQLREIFTLEERTIHVTLFTVSFAFCLFGYSQLLLFLYPLFGYLGLATLLRISVYRRRGGAHPVGL